MLAAAVALPAAADVFTLPPDDVDLVGEPRTIEARYEDTLLDIARRFNLGHDEIVIANPEVNRWLPGKDAAVFLPTQFILPRAERKGLVLNVPEMRIYYYPPAANQEKRVVVTHPVSIGRTDWSTPLGLTKITKKVEDPPWVPPKSIRLEAEERGTPLPEVIPPGPENPLGRYAMRLGLPGYLIHSTNRPFGIGMRVTHGCVRMYPEDIASLFSEVPVGTPVHIVNQFVKVGWLADSLFIEVHPPLEEDQGSRDKLMQTAMDAVLEVIKDRPVNVDRKAIELAVQEQRGVPRIISVEPDPVPPPPPVSKRASWSESGATSAGAPTPFE